LRITPANMNIYASNARKTGSQQLTMLGILSNKLNLKHKIWTFFILCMKNRFFTLNARKTGFEHVIMLGILSYTPYLKHKIQHEN